MGDRSTRYKVACQIILVILILSLGCNVIGGTYLWRISKQSLNQEEVADLEDDAGYDQEERETYAKSYYAKQMQSVLTPEELFFVAQRQWECVLSANGKSFTGPTMAIENTNNVRIMVAEVIKNPDSLPIELLKQGSIGQSDEADTLLDHIQIYTTIPYEITTEEAEGSIKYYYEFKDVPKGTVIGLEVSEVLKERLACKETLKENRLQVIVR